MIERIEGTPYGVNRRVTILQPFLGLTGEIVESKSDKPVLDLSGLIVQGPRARQINRPACEV